MIGVGHFLLVNESFYHFLGMRYAVCLPLFLVPKKAKLGIHHASVPRPNGRAFQTRIYVILVEIGS